MSSHPEQADIAALIQALCEAGVELIVDAEGLGDVDTWAEMGAEAHLAFAHLITELPASVDPMLLVPHMRSFIRFLVGEGAIREADVERLDHPDRLRLA